MSNEDDLPSEDDGYFNLLEKLSECDRNEAFLELFSAIEGTVLMRKKLPDLLSVIDKVSESKRYDTFFILFDAVKSTEVINETYLSFLKHSIKLMAIADIGSTQYMLNLHQFYDTITELIEFIEGTQLLDDKFTEILEGFVDLILNPHFNENEKLPLFYKLFNTVKESKVAAEKFTDLLDTLEKMPGYITAEGNPLFQTIKGTELLNEKVPDILDWIEKFSDKYHKFDTFFELIEIIKGTEAMNDYYDLIDSIFLDAIRFYKNPETVQIDECDYFSIFINTFKNTNILKDRFTIFLNWLVDSFFDDEDDEDGYAYWLFSELITAVKDTEIMNTNFSLIERRFTEILTRLDTFLNEEIVRAFLNLISTVKETELMKTKYNLIETKFTALLLEFDKFDETKLYDVISILGETLLPDIISVLISTVKGSHFIKDYFRTILKLIDYLTDLNRFKVFSELISAVRDTEVLTIYYDLVEMKLTELLSELNMLTENKRTAFYNLFYAVKGTQLIETYFTEFFNISEGVDDSDKFYIFSTLVSMAKKTELINSHYDLIETKFTELFNPLEKSHHRYRRFNELINAVKGTEVFLSHYTEINLKFFYLLNNLMKLTDDRMYDSAFNSLVRAIKETDLLKENFILLLNYIEKFPDRDEIYSFLELIDKIEGTDVINIHYSLIEKKIPYILNKIHVTSDFHQINTFEIFINRIKRTELMNETVFMNLLNTINGLDRNYRNKAFTSLINSFEGTDILKKNLTLIKEKFPNNSNKIELILNKGEYQ